MNFYQGLGYLVFGSRLKRLSEAFLNDMNKIYKKRRIGFDASWFPVFYILSEKNHVSIRYIADELGISHSAASQMISSLQQKGYIRSVISKQDARHKAVTFTAKGQRLLHKIKPVWEALEKAMKELTGKSGDGKTILDGLTAIEKKLQEETVFERVEKILK